MTVCQNEEPARSAEASFLNVVEEIIHPRYLSLLEREQLQDLRACGVVDPGDRVGDAPRTVDD